MKLFRALFCALTLSLAAPAQAEPAQAPPWSLKTPEGKTVNYPADAGGRPTVLLFWPSWCPFSRALQPYVDDIWKDYRGAGVNVWTINILENRGGDPVQAMKDRGLGFPLLLDGDPLIGPYGISRTPWFLVIDGKGRIVYSRPDNVPSPVDVAKKARETLNGLLGARAVPLPASYPPPYDLHLRKPGGPQSSRLESAAAPDADWRPWAQRYLDSVPADESAAGIAPQGPVDDGKAAIRIARELWTQRWGAEQTSIQAPYRSYRRNNRWLVLGSAKSGQLGQGWVLVLEADSGRVIRLSQGDTVP
ncbi:NTF2 fold immunity protein [Solimonas fluminis]|nr:NTF2 fold immunity protein [Solimonas fluminis]